jgi:hypothetical protein
VFKICILYFLSRETLTLSKPDVEQLKIGLNIFIYRLVRKKVNLRKTDIFIFRNTADEYFDIDFKIYMG